MTGAVLVFAGMVISGAPDAATDPAQGQEKPVASAQVAFRRGIDAYDEKHYETALQWFQDAYRLTSDPRVLFNIAQAHRALGNCQQALVSLDGVITASGADPSLVNRARGMRDGFAACAPPPTAAPERVAMTAAKEGPKLAPWPPEARSIVMVAPAPPKQPSRAAWLSSRWGRGCMVSAGAALGFGIAGAGLGWMAHDRANEVNDATTWTPEVQSADGERRSLAAAATVTLAASGVAGILSGAMCWLGWRSRD